MEKIIKKKLAYKGRVLSIEDVDIDFKNGRLATFEVIRFSNKAGVSALPIDEYDNVILIKQFNLGVRSRILTIPSGGLDDGVSPLEQMNNELQEEIGYKSNSLSLMLRSHQSPGYVDSPGSYIYLAKDLVISKKEGDEVEDIEVVKIPYKKTLQMVKDGEFIDGKTIQAILFYEQFIRSIEK